MDIDRIANRVTTSISFAQEQEVQQQSQSAPIIGGQSVNVTNGVSSDLEKLVLQLKSENANTQEALAQQRIAILSTVLDSMSERVSQQQKEALLEMEKLNSANSALEKEIAALRDSKQTLIADRDLLQMQIESLEKMTETEIENGEAHRELIAELKEKLAEDDKKIRECENAIASKASQISANSAKIEGLIASVGAATMREVTAAVKAAAGADDVEVADVSESNAEREKAEKKAEANDPAALFRGALDKLEAEIRKTLEENQAIKA